MAIATTDITERVSDGENDADWGEMGTTQSSATNNDIFLTSIGSRAKKVSNSTKGFGYQINATGEDITSLVFSIRWMMTAGVGALEARSAGGAAFVVEDTNGDLSYWDVDGNDTYFGGWRNTAVSLATTPSRGDPADLSIAQYVGMVWICTDTVGGGDPNAYIDQILSWPIAGVTITGNSTSVLADLVDVVDVSGDGPWSVFERRSGQLFSKAKLILAPDASDMSDSDETLTFENPVFDGVTVIDCCLDEIGLIGADADNVTLTRCGIIAAEPDETATATANREFVISASTDFDLDTCILRGFDGTLAVALGGSGQAISNTTFDACGKLTAGAAVMRDCIFRRPTDATGAFFWDEGVDIDRCDFFSGGTGYGVHYRPTGAGPFVENLDSFDFTDYGADETADAAVHINPVTTTVTITFGIDNAPEPTYDEDAGYSGIFTSVPSPVILLITALAADGLGIVEDAIVLIKATEPAEPLPFEESVVGITQTAGTATADHTTHGMATNDKIFIEGANEPEYNGVHQIEVTGASAYTFPIDSGADSPATGTLICTWVAISGFTDSDGEIQLSRVLAANQTVGGTVKKKTYSPLFVDGVVAGTYDSVDGFSQIVQLISDE